MSLHKEKRKLIIYFCITILIAVVIFLFSSQPADESSRASGRILRLVIAVFGQILPEEWLEFLIRKAAHVTVFFLLGWSMTLLVCQAALVKNGGEPLQKKWWQFWLISVVLCLLYACSDEWHQTYVPGRAGAIRDVCIDGIGFCCSTLLVSLWKRRM